MPRITLITISVVCSMFCLSPVKSQYYFYNEDYFDNPVILEIGLSGGGMNCLTDLGGKHGTGTKFMKDINWNATRLCGGVYAGITYDYIASARLEFSYGQVTATDNVLKNDRSAAYGRFMRNLNFRSAITETSLLIELHPLQLLPQAGDFLTFSPYLLTGIGIYRFSPEANYNNSWISLPALHTEGQGFPEYKDRKNYPLSQKNLPLGIGIKHEISAIATIRLEIIYRKLWTDYLDDVSKSYVSQGVFSRNLSPQQAALARKLADRQLLTSSGYLAGEGGKRGNPENNDSYFSLNFKAALVFGRSKRN